MPPSCRSNMLVLDVGMVLPPRGGYVEDVGRNRSIDGCSASLLVMPPHEGDPCVNQLHIVAGTVQTEHQHPSDRIGSRDGTATRPPSGCAGLGGPSLARRRDRDRALRLHADPALHDRRSRPRQVGSRPDRLCQFSGLPAGRAGGGMAGRAGGCAPLAPGRSGSERAQHRRHGIHDEPGCVPAPALCGRRRRRPGDGAGVLPGDGPARRRRPRWLGGGDVCRRRERHRDFVPGGSGGGIRGRRLARPVVLLRGPLPRAFDSGCGPAAKAASVCTG